MSTYDDVCKAEEEVRRVMFPHEPRIGVILGSGLGAFASSLTGRGGTFYDAIPGFINPQTEGHHGKLVTGLCHGVPVVALQGRVHFYEGYSLDQVVLPARALVKAGCEILIITNACGGINRCFEPGDLVLIRDHINLTGHSPLTGDNDDRLGKRFPDQSNVYSAELRGVARAAARKEGIILREGVYNWHLGPQYETPTEIEVARRNGADLAGMSTVPEAIAVSHMGAQVLGISCVTNKAAGLQEELSHDEVKKTADAVAKTFVKLLSAVVVALGKVMK